MAQAQVTATLPDVSGAPGTGFTVPIVVSEFEGVNSFDLTFTYGADIQIDSVVTTGFPADEFSNLNQAPTAGGYQVAGFDLDAVSGSGTFAVVYGTFVNAGTASVTTSLEFNGAQAPSVTTTGFDATITTTGLGFGVTSGAAGETVRIPVVIGDFAGDLNSFGFTVTYDEDILTITGVDTAGTLTGANGFTVDGQAQGAGAFQVAGFGLDGIDMSGTLVYLEATLEADGVSALTATNLNTNPEAGAVTPLVGRVEVGDFFPLPVTPTHTGNLAPYNSVLVGPLGGDAAPITAFRSSGSGTANAFLSGDTLRVAGSFDNLLGTLINIAGTPAHIHLGSAADTGPVAIPLVVNAGADSMSGSFPVEENTFVLSELNLPNGVDLDSLVSALNNGNTYFNVHTTAYPAGELRSQVLLTPNAAPARVMDVEPLAGFDFDFTNEGDSADAAALAINWSDVSDPNGNEVIYQVEIASDSDFNDVVYSFLVENPGALFTVGQVDAILDTLGVDYGATSTFSLRVNSSDGAVRTLGNTIAVTVTRQDLPPAVVQVIHSAPDPFLDPVDIYLGGTRILDDLAYREGTGPDQFTLQPGPVTIGVARGSSVSANDVLYTFSGDLPSGNFVAIALGTLNVPDAEEVSLLVLDNALFDAPNEDSVYVRIVHGSPDAPTVDVNVIDDTPAHDLVAQLADDLEYAQATEYIAVAPNAFNVQLTTADGAEVAVFRIDLAPFEGEALTLIANGLLNPPGGYEAEYGLQLYGVSGDGVPIRSRLNTDTEQPTTDLPETFAVHGNYPNPFNPSTAVRFDLPQAAEVTVQVIDVMGREVLTVPAQTMPAGTDRMIQIDASSLASGTYLYRVVAKTADQTHISTGKMTLVK